MWTYFIIFLSLCAVISVFVRRIILTYNAPDQKQDSDFFDEEPLNDNHKKSRLSSTNKQKVVDLCKRGQVLVQAGKDEEALKCFVQALSIDSLHRETMSNLAVLYMHKKMFSPASALFKEIALLDDDPVSFSHLGLALYNQNDFEGALLAYQKAVELDSTRAQRFVSLCQVYRSLKNHVLSLVALNKALEIDENNIDYLLLKLDLLSVLGYNDFSKDVVELILKLDPSNREAKLIQRKLPKSS